MNAPADNRGDGGGREVMRSECNAISVLVGDYPVAPEQPARPFPRAG